VKINYLYNSAFKIETEKHVLIFDYYLDSVEGGEKNSTNGAIGEEDLINNKEILVFCTHSHGDHYSDVIFSWTNIRPDIKYILSSEIDVENKNLNIYKLSAYDEINLDSVYIKAFNSTDIGISFLVKVEEITIFHAGDLNWWHWYDESDEDNNKQEKYFKEEVAKLKGTEIDITFFPVDARLRDSYCAGAEYFIQELSPKHFIPMHFREEYFITKEFKNKDSFTDTQVYEISRRGEEIKVI
jgi:L-ascorbate metabolism protein UlaG (beta-lactamase superfamily)